MFSSHAFAISSGVSSRSPSMLAIRARTSSSRSGGLFQGFGYQGLRRPRRWVPPLLDVFIV
jgi:hypothetical protein